MKITKYTHSCLLIEVDDNKILIDPGEFTWKANDLTDDVLTGVDYCLITHEHFDHFHEPALKRLHELSPNVLFKAGPAMVAKFKEINLSADSTPNDLIKLEVGEHAHLWDGVPVFENTKMTIAGKLLDLGDSMDAASSPEVLAVPIFGPWLGGTVSNAVNLAMKLQPKYVIPMHDWHYHTEAREGFVKRLQEWCEPKGIKVIGAELGKPYEIEV